jgi:uncharacterized protein (DUF1800 family)
MRLDVAYSNGAVTQAAARTSAGLERYQGPWDSGSAAHLLRRTTFGARKSDVAASAARSLDSVLSALLSDPPTPAPPLDPATGQTWVTNPFDSTNDGRYQGYLKAWWMGLMATQGLFIREKMVLFWHNHFVSEYQTVSDSRYMYVQNSLFRRYALGNIKELVKTVTVDPAMLIYLNGYRNRGDGNNISDENYGRELQELFTIGKGPELGPGDYTNYTEQDVKAAARLLTGWRVNGYRDTQNAAINSYFDSIRHDVKDQVFTAAYQSTRIAGGIDGAREINDLIEMIFRQPETAKFLCRKLYRWFIYYDIDSTVEAKVISPLADIMRTSNYEVKPVLDALFRSTHFFDAGNVGCLIKSPVDLLAGALSTLELQLPSADSQASSYYTFMASLATTSANLQMTLMDPPNVAGWQAFYQVPEFHRLWINGITLPSRWAYTDSLVNGIRAGSARVTADPLALVQQVSNPGDPQIMVAEIARNLLPITLTSNQVAYLVFNVLIPGLPDIEWGYYWSSYAADPANSQKKSAVVTRLSALLKFMMRMAEFQLS